MFTFPVGFFGSGTPGGGDPFWSNVVLYLPLTGTNGQTTFTDVSQYGHTVTRNGDVVISTAQAPALTGVSSSAYFDGSGDFLSLPITSTLDLDANLTVEFFLFHQLSSNNFYVVLDSRISGTQNDMPILLFNSSPTVFQLFTISPIVSGTVNGSGWRHIAVTRASGIIFLFVDGVQQGSGAANNTLFKQFRRIGNSWDNFGFPGYLSHLRITKGVARYTANFTPPTAPFPIG